MVPDCVFSFYPKLKRARPIINLGLTPEYGYGLDEQGLSAMKSSEVSKSDGYILSVTTDRI